ncbi:MAG: hypothetical protein TREMPRED_001033 [Tremellales sp. Tagirdzhanova-0007]|nr:MAG: hypothetical protein TREMPRED_001033 [Tremellales sp. Tagirdzhanova-0007]
MSRPAAPASASSHAPPTTSQALNEKIAPSAKAYGDEIIDGPLTDFVAKSKAVGGVVEQQSALLTTLCSAQEVFLQMASSHTKPSANALAPLLKPQADAIQAIIEAKDKLGRGKEGREWGACLSTVGEGVSAWGWVQVEPAPAPFVAEMKNAGQFWADRVTKQFKETNPDAIAWAKSFMALVDALQAYVKQWHTTGVSWNPKGSAAPSSMPPTNSAPATASGSSLPTPVDLLTASSSHPGMTGGGPVGLLADLNRGGSVTSGLRKVDSSQMTHKNPDLRTSSVVSDSARKEPSAVQPKAGVLAQPAKKTPRLELENGNKWIVEYQEDNKTLSIDDTQLHQVVQIFGCKNSVIKISGKINAVTMVACKKTSVIVDSAVSSLSITSSPSFEVQITGSVPSIQIDTTDSGQVYLSKECMEVVEIVTSKTSSINISVPTGEGGEFEERPVSEQMKSRVVKGKLVTEIVEHAG